MAAANPKTDAEVKAYWNSEVGERWVRDQGRLDDMLAVFSDAALKAARVTVGETALDIGCGCFKDFHDLYFKPVESIWLLM